MSAIQCSNPDHPEGAYHEAATVPYSWDWPARLRQRLNRAAWGCSCAAAGMLPANAYLGDRVLVSTCNQGGGSPIVDLATTTTEGGTYWCLAIRRRQAGESGLRPCRPNYDAEPAIAMVVGQRSTSRPRWQGWLIRRPWRRAWDRLRLTEVGTVGAHPEEHGRG